MKNGFIDWIKGKLDSFEDTPTPADWAAMEELIKAQPSLISKAWYKTTGGMASIAGAVSIAIGGLFWMNTEAPNSPAIQPASQEMTIDAHSTPQGSSEAGQSQLMTSEEAPVSIMSEENDGLEADQSAVRLDDSQIELNESIAVSSSNSGSSVAQVSQQEATESNAQRNVQDPSNKQDLASPTLVASRSESGTRSMSNAASSTEESASMANPQNGIIASNSKGETDASNNEIASSETSNMSSEAASTSSASNAATSNSANSENRSSSSDVAASNESGSNEDSGSEDEISPAPVVRRTPSAYQWSASLYGIYSMNTQSPVAEANQTMTTLPIVGMGAEVNVDFSGWRASTGFQFTQESRTMESRTYHESITRSSSSWYEWDTSYVSQVDSTWQIDGINQGHWQVDTISVAIYDSVLHEAGDSTIVIVQSNEIRKQVNYRYSIPVLFGRKWEFGNWTTSVQAGPVLTLSSTTWSRGGAFLASYQTYGIDLMGRLELGYQLTEHWNIFGRVGYRINTMSNADYGYEAWKRQSVPASIGVHYSF